MPTELGQKLSHFRLLEKIGQGGMGVVYRARDEKLRRDVALKILPPEVVEDPERRLRFLREARAAAAVNHPNIATIYEVDQSDGVLFLAMELVEGKTLRSLLRKGALPLPDAVRYATGIARGLAEAHKVEIVHRDIKPENVIVGPEGQVKILDFGLAKLIEERDLGSRMTTMSLANTVAQHETRAGRVIGTAVYMSPEQARGDPVDIRSDIFSFGTTLYEMVTGRLPFRQGTLLETLESIQTDEPVPASRLRRKVPRRLQTVLDRCLAKEPAARYASGLELSEALRRVATRPRWAIPAMAAAVAVVAVVLTMMEFQKRKRSGGALRPEQVASLVALPSTVLGAGADGYLADAIPQLLSKCLVQVDHLVTKLPPSSLVYEKVGRDKTKIANAYEVGALVESILSLQADGFSLSVHLADAQSRRLLWSHDYRGLGQDYVGAVQEACDGLREALRPSAEPITSIAGLSATADVEMTYQRGVHHLNRYNHLQEPEDFALALSALELAFEEDPDLAKAAASISFLHYLKWEVEQSGSFDPMEAASDPDLARSKSWAKRAIQIDPRDGEALAMIAILDRVLEPTDLRALAAAVRAASLRSQSGFVHNALGGALGNTRLLSLATFREATRVDPLYLYPYLNAAECLGSVGRFQEALLAVDEGLKLYPDAPWAVHTKARLLIEAGRVEEARDLLPRMAAMEKTGVLEEVWFTYLNDMIQVESEDEGLAQEALDRLTKSASVKSMFDAMYFGLIARLAEIGRSEEALQILARRAEVGASMPYDFLMLNPSFEPLRGDERFAKIAEEARSGFEDVVTVLQEAGERGELPAYLANALGDMLARLDMASPS